MSSQVKMPLTLRSRSAPIDSSKPCHPLSGGDLCSTNTPFSSGGMKLNIPEKNVKLSATLPMLSKKQSNNNISSGKNDYNYSSRSDRGGNSDSDSLKNSVSAANDKLKIAIAKSMPRALPRDKEKGENRTIKKTLPPQHSDANDNVSDNESPPTPVKALTEADLRQIAVERANRSIKKVRMREQAEREAVALDRRNRAEMIAFKQKQRDRYRAEVYAVNAILKKLEMSRFDVLREERGSDRSFLDQASNDDDDTSVEDNTGDHAVDMTDTNGTGFHESRTIKTSGSCRKSGSIKHNSGSNALSANSSTSVSTSITSNKTASRRMEGKKAPHSKHKAQERSGKGSNEIKEPLGSRGSKQSVSSRKLHLSASSSSEQLEEQQQQRSPSSGAREGSQLHTQKHKESFLLEQKYQCPPHNHVADDFALPPSTSESEVCNFSFGV